MSIQTCRNLASRIGRQIHGVSTRSSFLARQPTSKLPTQRQYAVLAEPASQQVGRFDFFPSLRDGAANSILSWAIWLIKRTYQPSLLKKKRQCGYMKRKQTVGGRRILKRRKAKGRKRLFGA